MGVLGLQVWGVVPGSLANGARQCADSLLVSGNKVCTYMSTKTRCVDTCLPKQGV